MAGRGLWEELAGSVDHDAPEEFSGAERDRGPKDEHIKRGETGEEGHPEHKAFDGQFPGNR